ncbi:MAG: ECF transporter S component [Bacillota bacterium]|nr:ECF transporter S component [Bacillota bacterium]MDI3318128.1 ECF transporter S component [Bacillota bacterium]
MAQEGKVWSFRLTTLSLALIPVAVGINYVGKLFAATLKLPLWLDSVGTILSGMLAGPWIGALSGAVNNAIYGLTADPVSFWYLITSLGIGLAAGYLAFAGWIRTPARALVTGLIVAAVAAVVSTPINVLLWHGQTGNVWGDAIYAVLVRSGWPVWLASFVDEAAVDLPDKVVTVFVAYLVYRALPERFVRSFGPVREIERL